MRKIVAGIMKLSKKVHWELRNCFGHGNVVVTERLDQWDWDATGAWQLALPVCGMFELTVNGHIIEWREYYDNELWRKHGGPSLSFCCIRTRACSGVDRST